VARGPYGRFARYYDAVYEGMLDYRADCDYLERLFRRALHRRPRSVLDLGCGTGNHAVELARRGHDVLGLDRSNAQLAVARQKVCGTRFPVTFVQGDMARFRLRRQFDAAICMFGGFGYLLTDRDVRSHFGCVRDHLAPDGTYVFEFWQASAVIPGHRSWLARDRPYRLLRLDESTYDSAKHRLTFDFHFYVFRGKAVVDRFSESHALRVHTIREIRKLLSESGFSLAAAYGGTATEHGFTSPKKNTFRITAVARPMANSRHR
jgi:SAM-dependent methyltransferase